MSNMTYEDRKKKAVSLLTEAFWDREIFHRICLEKDLPIHDGDCELSATEKRIVEEHATSFLFMLEGMAPASVPGFWDAFKQAVDEVLESFYSQRATLPFDEELSSMMDEWELGDKGVSLRRSLRSSLASGHTAPLASA
jgi:hypothetical protein